MDYSKVRIIDPAALPPDEIQRLIKFANERFPQREAEGIVLALMDGDRDTLERMRKLRKMVGA